MGSDQLFSSVTFHRRTSTAQQQCRLVPKCSALMATSEKKKVKSLLRSWHTSAWTAYKKVCAEKKEICQIISKV